MKLTNDSVRVSLGESFELDERNYEALLSKGVGYGRYVGHSPLSMEV